MWLRISDWWVGSIPIKQAHPGPGRNIPNLSEMLQQAKLTLTSPEVIEVLQISSGITETMLVRNNLKHVDVRPRQTSWPCTNPLFIELRQKRLYT